MWTCQGGVDLRGFRNRYFVHPNQVAAAERGLSSLEEAVSVCVRRCPQTLPQGNLTWICKYPYDQWDVHVQVRQNRSTPLGRNNANMRICTCTHTWFSFPRVFVKM